MYTFPLRLGFSVHEREQEFYYCCLTEVLLLDIV
jgi:hypothetical protein